MRHNLCSRLWGTATENLLHRPEARVIEPLRERHNVRRRYVLVLLRPCAARQLVRLNGGKDGEVQQRDLSGQLLRRDTQRTADDRVHVGERGVRRETVGFLR